MTGPGRQAATGLAMATAVAALAFATSATAAVMRVTVTDERGQPIERVAVYATPKTPAPRTGAPPSAVMDQHDNRFVPHVLVVQAGADVVFPNSDVVSHHVYSFSEAKSFELGLYKGNVYPPIHFDHPGVVVLGCNIHDSMLGYIVVVDTPYYAVTDANGIATLPEMPNGDYAVEAWTARARPGNLPAAEHVTVSGADAKLALKVTGKLSPDYDGSPSSLSWERY